MRVLIVTSWYPNKNHPVYGTFVREQARALSRYGVEVILYYPFDDELPTRTSCVQKEEGLRTYRANHRLGEGALGRLAGGVLAGQELKKLIKMEQPDLLHVHVGFPAGIIADFATMGMNLPYVITEHMSYLREYTDHRLYRGLLKHAYEKAARVLPVSPYLAEQFKPLNWQLNLQPMPNIVDISRFPLVREHKNQVKGILFVGGMDAREIKGLQYLLPAFAQVLSELPEGQRPKLHLVGDGVKRADYERFVGELGITENCIFHGMVSPEDMPKYYQSCEILVVSSLKETFGVVLIEAIASGLPVLATACGGPNDIVTKEVGLLVEPGSTQALAKGLHKLITDYSMYSPEKIREYAVKYYSPEVIIKQLKDVYKEVQEKFK
jgi:glycosyltransferase involved in cell wall biosynthesis